MTVMTNYGFHSAMEEAGIQVATTPVGDRHVMAELTRRGWALGGEQSGHIIDTGFAPSGDGIASALLALEALDGRDLAARDAMTSCPSLINVQVADRGALEGADRPGGDRAREQRARGPRPRAGPRLRHGAADQGDGGGAGPRRSAGPSPSGWPGSSSGNWASNSKLRN